MAERKAKAAEESAAATPDTPEGDKTPPKAKTAAAAPLAAPQPKPEPAPQQSPFALPNAVTPHIPHRASEPRLLDEDGNEVKADDVLTYPEKGDPSGMATVNQRVFRRYIRAGTTTEVTDLAYPAGSRISIAEANRFTAEFTPAPAPEATSGE